MAAARAKILEAQLRAEVKDLQPEQTQVLSGKSCGCKIGAARNETRITSIAAAMKAVKAAGQEAAECFTITLGKLEEVVGTP